MHTDLVDIDLARHLRQVDKQDAFDAWMQQQAADECQRAKKVLADPQVWDWHGPAHVLQTTEQTPYSADEALLEAREYSAEVNRLYAELLASDAAKELRAAVAADWADRMWETRTQWEIEAAALQHPSANS